MLTGMTLDEMIARAGGVMKFAALVGLDHSTISSGWRRTGKVPIKHARALSGALSLPLYEIRDDVWPIPRHIQRRRSERQEPAIDRGIGLAPRDTDSQPDETGDLPAGPLIRAGNSAVPRRRG